MSYARFSETSDVYVYLGSGHLACCGCKLDDQWEYETTAEMVAHLEKHRQAGHKVPDGTIEALLGEAAENDALIRGDR